MTEPQRNAPDLEDLAAYVDGRLSTQRRAWVEEHLVRDEELYEIFQATVEFQQQHDGAAERPNAGWSQTWLLVPLAAAAALVLVVTPTLLRERTPSERWTEQLQPAVIAALTENWSDPGWGRNRSGPGDCPNPATLPFRMGAWSLDLRLALLAGDDAEAQQLAARLAILADCGTFYPQELAYTRLTEEWAATRAVDRREQAAKIERELAGRLGEEPRQLALFQLGAWAEAGRLAAVTRDAQALVGIVRGKPEGGEIPEIAAPLATLETLARRSPLEERDFTAAAEAFGEVLEILAG